MAELLANRPSPRPGFTHVADARARSQGTVVVVLSDSPGSAPALCRAAQEAAMGALSLHVLDTCSPGRFEEYLLEDPERHDARERSIALSILRSPNLTISRVDIVHFTDLVDLCRRLGASLLVVNAGWLRERGMDSAIFETAEQEDLTCDVLISREAVGAAQ